MKTTKIYIILFAIIFSACIPKKFEIDKNHISVSINPQKYFIERIARDYYSVNVLVPSGSSPATYEPTARQVKEVTKSVSYMKIGNIGFEKAWMERFSKINKKMTVTDMSKGINLIRGEQVKHGDHFHDGGVDPHIWLSLKSAKIIAKNTLNALIILEPSLKEGFVNNYVDLITEIDKVEKDIIEMLSPYEGKSFLIYHPALGYFARDFNLNQIAIELEGKTPTPAHLKNVVDKSQEENIRVIFIQKEFDAENAKVIATEIGAEIIEIFPLSENWLNEIKITSEKLKAAFELLD